MSQDTVSSPDGGGGGEATSEGGLKGPQTHLKHPEKLNPKLFNNKTPNMDVDQKPLNTNHKMTSDYIKSPVSKSNFSGKASKLKFARLLHKASPWQE